MQSVAQPLLSAVAPRFPGPATADHADHADQMVAQSATSPLGSDEPLQITPIRFVSSRLVDRQSEHDAAARAADATNTPSPASSAVYCVSNCVVLYYESQVERLLRISHR